MKAAERWIADRQERILAGDKTALFGGVDAYLAGDEAGARRERSEIVDFAYREISRLASENTIAQEYLEFAGRVLTLFVEAVKRGEHRGDE